MSLLIIPQANHFITNLGLSLESEFSFYNYGLILMTGFLVVIIFCIPTVSSIEQIDSDIIVDPVDKFFTLLVRPLNDSPEFNYLNSELLFFDNFVILSVFCGANKVLSV